MKRGKLPQTMRVKDISPPDLSMTPIAAGIRRSFATSATLALVVNSMGVLAAPVGGKVTGGKGEIIRPDANTTVIRQTSHNLVADWQGFNVAADERVLFKQPGSQASALNRIFDQNPSHIFGNIEANGRVFLMNPNGILFGKTAQVNVGALVASGLDVSKDDFMRGKLKFKGVDGTSGTVVNQGVLQAATGGSVDLVGKAVANEGKIIATAGQVNLAAGEQATLDFEGDGLMRFSVDEAVVTNAESLDAAVSNSGEINADGGHVVLTGKAAKDVFNKVVNNEGIVKAGRVDNRGGVVRLVGLGGGSSVLNTGTVDVSATAMDADSQPTGDGGEIVVTAHNIVNTGALKADATSGNGGTIVLESSATETDEPATTELSGNAVVTAKSKSGEGGTVHLLGDQVGLFQQTLVDVSGGDGGGTVLVGGDVQGQNPKVKNAEITVVAPDAKVQAKGIDDGAGGTVIVYADDHTEIYGELSVRGGEDGGGGGFIETSGKDSFVMQGKIDIAAGKGGKGGHWLIDPRSVEIRDVTGTNIDITNIATMTGFTTYQPGTSTTDSVIFGSDLRTALGTGDVTIVTADTQDTPVNAAAREGDITFSSGFNFDGVGTGRTLTLRAADDIIVSGAITDGTITMVEDSLNLVMIANSDGVDIAPTDSGTYSPDTGSGRGDIQINGAINLNNGNLVLSVDGGQVTQMAAITAAGLVLLGTQSTGLGTPSYTLTNAGNDIDTLAGNVAGSVDFLDTDNFAIGTVSYSAVSGANFDSATSVDVDGLTATGDITLSTTGTLSQSQAITTPTLTLLGRGIYNLAGANNDVDTLDVDDEIAMSLGGDLSFRDDDGFAITAVNAGTNDVILSSTGTVTQSGIITANGLSLLGTGGIYTLNTENNAITTLAGNTGTVSFQDNTGFAIGTVEGTVGLTATGNVVLSSTGTVTQSGIITANGLSLLGTGGIYTLNTENNAITTLAGNTGTVSFQDNTGFAIGTVEGTVGLTATGNITLSTAATVTQSQAITATSGSLLLLGTTTGAYTLNTQNNDVDTLVGDTGTVSFRDDSGFTIGALGGRNGLMTTGAINLQSASGDIILANDLIVNGNAALDLGAGTTSRVIIADNADITLSTQGGNISVTAGNGVQGTEGGGDETLRLASGGGTVTLPDVNTGETAVDTGLASFTISHDGVSTITVGTVATGVFENREITATGDFELEAITISGDLIINSGGANTITQRGIITARGLLLLGADGTYTLGTLNNDVDTLAGNTGTVSFQDNDGFAIGTVDNVGGVGVTNGLMTTGDIVLSSTGTVTQSQAIAANGLSLLGTNGIYTLDTVANDIATLAGNTGTVSFQDNNGFEIGSVGTTDGLTATVSAELTVASTGTLSQSQAITTPTLTLLGSGAYSLAIASVSNDVDTLDVSTGTLGGDLSFRDDDGFAITAVNAGTNDVILSSTGTVTQSGIITANGLSLLGTGGIYTLNTENNDVDTLAGNTGTVSFRDDNGFAIGTVEGTVGLTATGNVVLSSTGTVTQSGIITANGLSLLGTGGIYTLNTENNAITTLAGNTGTVSFQDNTGFAIGTVEGTVGLTATGNVVLSSTGTVTQSGIITANGLSLLGTGGIYTLNTENNAITTLAGNTGTVSFQDNTGFAIGTVEGTAGLAATVSAELTVTNTGTLSQLQAITTPTLTLLGRGIYNLAGANNDVDTLDVDDEIAMSLGGDLSFRDDDGFAITAVNAGTNDVILSSTGTVTQSGIITANGLSLLGTGGIYTLNTENNAITTLAGNTGTVSFQDNTGFAIGTVEGTVGLTATGNVVLSSTGTVTQSGIITANGLSLLGTGGIYTLNTENNAITTLAGNTGTVSFQDNTGFAIGTVEGTVGLTATGNVVLSSTGTVTQSGIITANGLSLLGTGGIYTLNTENNAITTLAGNTGTVSFQDNTGFAIGTVEGTVGLTATGNVVLSSTGTVTQSGIITANGLSLLGTGGIYTLNTENNAITTLAGNTGTVSFQDNDGFEIGTVEGTVGLTATGNVVLSSTGTVTQSGIITANGLSLLGTGGIYTLNTENNAITTLAGNTGTVSFQDNTGFAIGTVEGTVGLTATGNITLSTAATVTQSQAITATSGSLLLLGTTTGAYTLNTQNNDVDTLVGDTGTVSFRDDSGFTIGALGGRNGLMTTGAINLQSASGDIILANDLIVNGNAALDLGAGTTSRVIIADNADITLSTQGGNISVTAGNGVQGTEGGGDETLRLASGGGTVTLPDVNTGETAVDTGLASFTISHDGVSTITVGTVATGVFENREITATGDFELEAITISGDLIINSGGANTITQRGIITARGLLLLGADGTYTLGTLNNDVDTLAGNTGTVSFQDNDGFAIGTVDNVGGVGVTNGLMTTGDIVLSSTGTVTQSGIITANGLSLLGTGGIYTLNTENNAITTLAGNTGTVSFRDDNGFAIGTVEGTAGLAATVSAELTVTNTGTLSQSQAITTPTLTLLGRGIYNLAGANNDVDTLDVDDEIAMSLGGDLSFRDDDGFAITAVNAGTNDVILSSTGTVTQSGIITANGLSLLGTGGIYTLNTENNAITTLAGNTGTVSFQDNTGFAIGTVEGTVGLTATGNVVLSSTGTLSQSQAITTPTLTLLGSGTYSLGSANNVVTTLDVSTGTLGGDLSFRDDDGFAITAVNAGTNDVILSSTGTVTQSGIITANGLSLLGTGGIYTLNTENNAITTLAGNTGTVSFRDDNGFAIGTVEGTAGLAATVSAELTVTNTGTLSQSQAITTPTLTLLGRGIYNLAGANNDVDTLDVDDEIAMSLGGDLSFRDDDGFAITAVNAGTNDVILSSTGTVTQSGIITANGLSLLGTGGIYTLNTENNAITTLAGNTGTVSFRDDNGFAIGAVEGTAGLAATVSAELTVTNTGTLSQSQAITTPTLTLLGRGIYNLAGANNDVDTLDVDDEIAMSLGGDLSFRDDDGFAITAVNAGTNDVILSSTGTVTQSGIITANGLSLLGTGGIYTLNTENNAITTLAGNTGTVSFQDNTGFAIGTVEGTVGLTATGNVVLSSTGTLSQSQAITTPTLTLLGSGTYSLGSANNVVTTLDVSTGTLGGDLSFRDDDGFAITAVNAGTNDVILSSTGTVTQSGIITANGLSLLGTGGIYTLNTENNAITTLAGNTGTVSFQDNTGFAIGTVEGTVGLTATGNVVLSSTGTVTQSGIITANGLSLLGTGGIYTLNTENNAITTLAGNTGTVSFRDDNGFAIGTVEGTAGLAATVSAELTVTNTGTLSQSQAITTPTLTLLGRGIYNLAGANNDVDTLDVDDEIAMSLGGDLSFRDDDGFAITAVNAGTNDVILSSTGTVTQSGIITANGLSLLGTGGIYTLNTENNAITTLAGNTGTVSFRDNTGFAIGTVEGTAGLAATVSAELTVTNTGTLSQSQAITTPTLTLLGRGIYNLAGANNDVDTLDVDDEIAMSLGGDLSFRDDDGFAITAVNAGTNDVILSSTGTVTQSGIITANGLSLLGTGGIYTLNTENNAITTLAGNTGTVSFQDNTGFAIGTVEGTVGLTATGNVVLSSTGTVTQSGIITANGLSLLGTGGIYTLNTENNAITTLAGNTGTVSFQDNTGFAIGTVEGTVGLTATGNVVLSSTGTVTQSGIITANGLSLLGTGGIYTLNTENNAITTLAGNTGTVSFQDNTGFAIGTVEGTVGLTATGNVVLSSTGTVTQSGIITANGLSLLGTGGIYTLNTENNAITTLAGNTGTVSFQDNTGFAIGTVEGTVGLTATGNVVLSSTGTVTQSGIITANGLSLLGTGGIYTLNTENNAITTLAGNTGTVSFQDNTGFAIGTVEGTVGLTATGNVVLSSTGTVTQSGIITANGLSLLGTGGIYTLNTENNAITTLAGNTGTVSFQDNTGFAIGTVEGTVGLTATGNVVLSSTGTVTQSGIITANGLSLLGTGGIYTLNTENNAITTLAGNTGTVSFQDNTGFAIGTVEGTVGLTATGNVVLSSTGTVTQSGIITANGLSLLGTGGIYTLNTENNAITTLAGNTGTVSFQDNTGFAIGTVEGTVGLTATGNVVLSSTGTVTQSGIITANGLSLLGTGGIYTLNTENNAITTLAGNTGTVSFQDNTGFAIGTVEGTVGLTATGNVVLSSTGTVTQSGIITANGLSLLGTGGIYTLNTENNAITTLAGNTGTVSFQDNTGFAIGTVEGTVGLTATGNVVLSSTGTVTQSGIITANGLSLLGTGGIYTLNTENNAITTLAGNTGTVSFQDNTGFAIGTVEGTVGLTATGNVVLSSTGTLSQSQAITTPTLTLLGSGTYSLGSANNVVTTLDVSTGTLGGDLSFRDDDGFAITAVNAGTNDVILSSTGTVTQSGIITANGLSLLGTGGIYTLNTENNAITTLAGNTGTVSFRDDNGFAIGTVEGTAGLAATVSAELTVTNTGTLSQSQAITTPTLTLLGRGIYNLAGANNDVDTLDVDDEIAMSLGGDLSFRDDDGFAITAVNAGTNDVILSSTGTVTQSGIITANGLSLLGTGGIYTLNTENNAITTLAGNTGTVSFRDDNGFAIGTVEGTAGLTAMTSVELTVTTTMGMTGTLSQSQAIVTPILTLLGHGIYNLDGMNIMNINNDVDILDVDMLDMPMPGEIAMPLRGDLNFRDADGFRITAVNAGTNDVTLTTNSGAITLTGDITQSTESPSITFNGDVIIDINPPPATQSVNDILTLTSDTINFNGMVTGSDTLFILPATDGKEIIIGAGSGNIDNTRFADFQGALFIGGAVMPDFISLFTTPNLDLDILPPEMINAIDIRAVKVTVTEHLTTMGPIVLLAGDIELASNTPDPGRANAGIAITAGGQGAPSGHNLLLLAIGGLPSQDSSPINPPSAGGGTIMINTRQTLEAGYIGMIATPGDVDRSANLVLALDGGGVELARGVSGGVAQFDPTSRITSVRSPSTGFDALLAFLGSSGFPINVAAVQASNPATDLVGTTKVGFIDTGLFEQELTVFSQVGTGIALSLSQCEELEGCSPNVTEEELNVLIAELEERLAALEQKVLELRASGELGELAELEELINGYRAELDNFLAYREELKEFLSEEVEEDIDLEEDIFGDEFVEDVIKQLARALEHIKERLQWLKSLKGDPEARARLSEATGIELTQEALDAIIKATEAQSELIEKRINLLLQDDAGLQQQSPPYFTAESGRPSQAIDYAPYRMPMFANGVWWF